MSYDKSDGSSRYNKEERGGWYCTNPKRHDEGNKHHTAEANHDHRAERNDVDPKRNPSAQTTSRSTQKSKPTTTKAPQQETRVGSEIDPQVPNNKKDKSNGGCCGCLVVFIILYILMQILS